MSNKLLLAVFAICALMLCAGCDGQFKAISKGIASNSKLTLYEGLPNQNWEYKSFTNELATKRIINFEEFPFYEKPLSITTEDIEELRQLSTASSSFKSYEGPKACGEYHPDYRLSWSDDVNRYDFLICFTCREVKIYGPSQKLIFDIDNTAFDRFKTILTKYRNQRPPSETSP